MRRTLLLYDTKTVLKDMGIEKLGGPEEDIFEMETETELYAVFKDGVLVERGEREIPVKEVEDVQSSR